MRKAIFVGIVTLATTFGSYAQDLEQVKKTIDAEKFSEARKSLKNLVSTAPDKGRNYFYLGQVYLALEKQDSAKIYFEKGKGVKDAGHLNYIGLAHVDLIYGNKTSAQNNIAMAMQNAKKKDTEEQIFIARAYLNQENPEYSKAIEAGKKAIASDPKSALAHLTLGDAYFADKNTNDAYAAYRNAYDLDNTLLRAKLQLAMITRNARAYNESIKAINEVITLDPNYGPAHRELAETYFAWGYNEPAKYQENTAKALDEYKKYMSLTDTSVDSRMRYADFLIITKDWKALEAEATMIQKMDKVNPRIYRYLGYAYIETGRPDAAIQAFNEFFAKADKRKIKGRDYLYLAKAKLASAMDANGVITNATKFNESVIEFSEIGVKLYKQKAYFEAAKLLDLAIKNPASKSFALDNYYYGNCILFGSIDKTPEQKATLTVEFEKANAAYAEVIKASPKTQDAYLNKGKLNRVHGTDAAKLLAVADYEGYVKVVTEKGEAELSKETVKKNLLDAYQFIGSSYAATDKAKAIAAFEEAKKLDPTNKYVSESLEVLKK
jgi:cytochrome c-type biogenesis protein CcmH/NrfG